MVNLFSGGFTGEVARGWGSGPGLGKRGWGSREVARGWGSTGEVCERENINLNVKPASGNGIPLYIIKTHQRGYRKG